MIRHVFHGQAGVVVSAPMAAECFAVVLIQKVKKGQFRRFEPVFGQMAKQGRQFDPLFSRPAQCDGTER